jgi:lipoate-protein ligase A
MMEEKKRNGINLYTIGLFYDDKTFHTSLIISETTLAFDCVLSSSREVICFCHCWAQDIIDAFILAKSHLDDYVISQNKSKFAGTCGRERDDGCSNDNAALMKSRLEALEKNKLITALKTENYCIKRTANKLDCNRRTVYRRMKKYDIKFEIKEVI